MLTLCIFHRWTNELRKAARAFMCASFSLAYIKFNELMLSFPLSRELFSKAFALVLKSAESETERLHNSLFPFTSRDCNWFWHLNWTVLSRSLLLIELQLKLWEFRPSPERFSLINFNLLRSKQLFISHSLTHRQKQCTKFSTTDFMKLSDLFSSDYFMSFTVLCGSNASLRILFKLPNAPIDREKIERAAAFADWPISTKLFARTYRVLDSRRENIYTEQRIWFFRISFFSGKQRSRQLRR